MQIKWTKVSLATLMTLTLGQDSLPSEEQVSYSEVKTFIRELTTETKPIDFMESKPCYGLKALS